MQVYINIKPIDVQDNIIIVTFKFKNKSIHSNIKNNNIKLVLPNADSLSPMPVRRR